MKTKETRIDYFKGVVKELASKIQFGSFQNDYNNIENDIKTLRQLTSDLHNLTPSEILHSKQAAFQLWNLCVDWAAATKGQPDPAHQEKNARIRHIACDVLNLSNSEHDSETRCVMLKWLSRTGKIWFDIKNYTMANQCWEHSIEIWESLQGKFPRDEQGMCMEYAEARSNMFSLHLWKCDLEFKTAKGHYNFALSSIEKAEQFSSSPADFQTLAVTCYNFGVILSEKEKHSEAVVWLEKAIGFEYDDLNFKSQKAKILRLLSNCYIALEQYEKSLSCAELSNNVAPHPTGSYLITKINLILKKSNAPKLMEIFLASESNFEMCMSIIQTAISTGWKEEALASYVQLSEKFMNSQYYEKLRFFQLELLLNHLKDEKNALQLLDKISSEHREGIHKLSKNTEKQVSYFIWNYSVDYYLKSDYSNALIWFRKSLNLVSNEDHINRSNCLRIISKCHLQLNEYDKALEAAQRSLEIFPNINSHFLLCILHIEMGNEVEASQVLNAIEKSNYEVSVSNIEVCAHYAYKKGKNLIAIRCLEILLNLFLSAPLDSKQGYYSQLLRCLIKLCLNDNNTMNYQDYKMQDQEQDSLDLNEKIIMRSETKFEFEEEQLSRVCHYLTAGLKVVEKFDNVVLFNDKISEVLWLTCTAWNCALKSIDLNQFDLSRMLFDACFEWSSFLPVSSTTLTIQRDCLYQSVNFLLKVYDTDKNMDYLKIALKKIEQCFKVMQNIEERISKGEKLEFEKLVKEQKEDDEAKKNLQLEIFLMDFEIKVKMHSTNLLQLTNLFENNQNYSEETKGKVLYQMAILAITYNPDQTEIPRSLIKKAINYFSSCLNHVHLSEAYRKLITILPSKDEAFILFEKILEMLQVLEKGLYPEQELKWLAITAFNNGVYFCRLFSFEKAEKWMSTSLKLIQFSTTKFHEEAEILSTYTEVLSKIPSPHSHPPSISS